MDNLETQTTFFIFVT